MKRRNRTVLFGCMTAIMLVFIWGHSLLSVSASAGESEGLMRLIKPLLDPMDRIDDDLFHHLLRKTAHFTEFALLGICMYGLMHSLNWRMSNHPAAAAALACVLAAFIDEGIQLFIASRGAQLRDVALDSAGAVTGVALSLLFHWILAKQRK